MNRNGVAAPTVATLLTLSLSGAACVGVANATATPALAPLPVEPADGTAPGCALAFLAAINTPSAETVRAFEDVHASTLRKGRATNDERLERMRGLNAEFGRMTFVRTLSNGARAISTAAESARAGKIELTFELSADEPGRVDAIAIASGPGMSAEPIDAAARNRVIDDVLKALNEGYVFPKVAEEMAAAVNARRQAGDYDSIADDAALARQLTEDLQAVSKDKHLRVRIAPTDAIGPRAMGPSEEEMRRENYGFRKVERLDGNIGYLRFDVFVPTDEAKAKAAAAIQFLADCDAIIFDMRHNGGGSPEMIQFITSYLFDTRTHLNDMLDREGKVVEEYWTLDEVPGKRVPASTKIFVLTSGRTFSGAEEFTYNLKNLQRATVIGETTGGGAHPIQPARISDRIVVTVPFMRANNPISKTNWEGTGVEPHVQCPAADALERAIELAGAKH